MIVQLNAGQGQQLGIPMMFPLTWEEHVAANMTAIPALEFFPGLMVKDLYKAYRAGIEAGTIQADASQATINYIATSTGKPAGVVADFLAAMKKTVAAGQADPGILTATVRTGVEEKVPAATDSVFSAATKGAATTINTLGIVAIAGLVLYAASIGILPKPKFETGTK